MNDFIKLKNVRICDLHGPFHAQTTDILIQDGVICQIGSNIDDGKIMAQNLHISLAWTDISARCGEPGDENKETFDSLAQAAAFGGFGQVCLLPDFAQSVTDSKAMISHILQAGAAHNVMFWPIAAATIGAKGEKLSNMLELNLAGAAGFSDGNNPIRPAALLFNILEYLIPTNKTLFQKPQDYSLSAHAQIHQSMQSLIMGLKGIPILAETLALAHDIAIAAQLPNAKLHIAGISAAASVEMIRQAKAKNQNITSHVPAYNLRFTDAHLSGFDANLKVNPPFRTLIDRDALLSGLLDGTIDAIASDHTPHTPESKEVEFDLADFGIAGIETAFSVALEALGRDNLDILIHALTSGPRRCLGLKPAHIDLGTKARFTIFDPDYQWVFQKNKHSKAQNNPLQGQKLIGKVFGLI